MVPQQSCRHEISIHALREEGDLYPVGEGASRQLDFNPRPPRGGRPSFCSRPMLLDTHFNPRPPRGGRPGTCRPVGLHRHNFNPRPPRGGRRNSTFSRRSYRCISIHALREEGDVAFVRVTFDFLLFQSTPSARRATVFANLGEQPVLKFQSTPSARRATAGSVGGASVGLDFNPRPPRGGRRFCLSL